MNSATSIPTLSNFDPKVIPYQGQVIYDLRRRFADREHVQQVLLSGSVGSAKSITLAHMVVSHCLLYPGSRVGIGRLSMPALKGTIFRTILEHMGNNVSYELNETSAIIKFNNGSEIRSFSWQDKKYMKFRSFEFSAFAIEELTENITDDAYFEILMRVGRLPHVPEGWVLAATNPDGPDHWAYKHFVENKDPNVHVYYSRTEQNPFLPKHYIETLRANLDAKRVQRMIYGQWVSIDQDVVYHTYDPAKNFINREYEINPGFPIYVSFDFNIGEGKPMSCVLGQYINDSAHFFDQCVVDGARTADIMEELMGRGLFDINTQFIITGDATGRSRNTRSIKSDYDIITEYISNYKRAVRFELKVPRGNPPIRTRHNLVNTYCQNSLGQTRLYVYKKADKLNEGLRKTKLKKGGNYIEDDSFECQHITTACGYALVRMVKGNNIQAIGIAQR